MRDLFELAYYGNLKQTAQEIHDRQLTPTLVLYEQPKYGFDIDCLTWLAISSFYYQIVYEDKNYWEGTL